MEAQFLPSSAGDEAGIDDDEHGSRSHLTESLVFWRVCLHCLTARLTIIARRKTIRPRVADLDRDLVRLEGSASQTLRSAGRDMTSLVALLPGIANDFQ
jgi:hypothetical protein